MQNGPSAKRISETSMRMQQAETVRDFKPVRSFDERKKNDSIKHKVCKRRVYKSLVLNRTGKFSDV